MCGATTEAATPLWSEQNPRPRARSARTEGPWPKELAKPSTADSRLINRGKINNANGNLSLLSAPWPEPELKPKQKPKTMVHGHRTLDMGHWKTGNDDEEDHNPSPAGSSSLHIIRQHVAHIKKKVLILNYVLYLLHL